MASPDELATQVGELALEPLAVVETPTSPSSGLALSRFEFETGKANDGTKIIMVEWDGLVGETGGANGREVKEGATSRAKSDDWDVSWDGKTAVLQVRDADADADNGGGGTCRVYLLLPPGAAVPPLISIVRKVGAGACAPDALVLRTKPMPAIFPAGLGGSEEAARRGVLHTIWANKRLAELDGEITIEMKENGEGVGLEMALQERQWIIDHFGLKSAQDAPESVSLRIPPISPTSPTSPRSPIGGRLGEKLRGLKLATSPLELAAATHAAKSVLPRVQPLLPPASAGSTGRAHESSNGGIGSLDAIVGTNLIPARAAGPEESTEEELFALPMSPRSPEMKRSPFSLL